MSGPLSGIRVLDLSRVMAGPWCTQIMADLGAEVIKVERPEQGDDTRHWGPPWLRDKAGNPTKQSAYYLSANRGKYSVTIDIGKPEGQALIRELAASCDVLVENFKTGGLEKKGLGYGDLSALNPGIVYCSITGFGHTGPMAHNAGYDYLIQAQSGLMSITGVADGKPGAGPQRVGMAVADLTTGMNAAIAVLAAIHHRNKTGEGQHIDMALLDVQVSWLANQALNYFCSGSVPGRTGEYHPNLAPYQPFPTKDGQVIIAVGNDAQFHRLCGVMGCEELPRDPRFATNPERVVHRQELVGKLCEYTRLRTSREWMDCLGKVQVPCGPIQNIAEVFEDPQVKHMNMFSTFDHEHYGKITTVSPAVKMSETPTKISKPVPMIGEHGFEILREFGYLDDEINKFVKDEIMSVEKK